MRRRITIAIYLHHRQRDGDVGRGLPPLRIAAMPVEAIPMRGCKLSDRN